jgi:hypothetical protein
MSLDDEIRKVVAAEVARTVPGAVRAAFLSMFQGDRRSAPRAKNGKRPKLTCPIAGCKNPFAPRYGGFCPDHHNTKGYKAWAASKKGGAKKR